MKKRGCLRWFVPLVAIFAISWAVFSSNPFAQGFRQLLGRKPDQPVLNSTFQVSPRGFRYYKISLPSGSKNMLLVGNFSSQAIASTTAGQPTSAGKIEVIVIRESAFEGWRQANSASSIYDSGEATKAELKQPLPDGPGEYYVIFSNKSDPVSAKKISANLVLHSGSFFSY
jgi:hypothetical protein